MNNVQIPRWLFDVLCQYHITKTEAPEDEREIMRNAIKDGLFEKAEKMIARLDYSKKITPL